MQSTKKAPLRKEEGTTVTGDDGTSIAQSGLLTMTQPVRLVNKHVTILNGMS